MKKTVRTLLGLLCLAPRFILVTVWMINKLLFNNTLIILFREIDRRFSPFYRRRSFMASKSWYHEMVWNGRAGRARWKIQAKHVVQNAEICARLRIHWFLMFDTTLNAHNAATTTAVGIWIFMSVFNESFYHCCVDFKSGRIKSGARNVM